MEGRFLHTAWSRRCPCFTKACFSLPIARVKSAKFAPCSFYRRQYILQSITRHYENVVLTVRCLLHVGPRDESVLGRRAGLQNVVGLARNCTLLSVSLLEIGLLVRFLPAYLRGQRRRHQPGVEFHRRWYMSSGCARRPRAFRGGRLNSPVTRILRVAIGRRPLRPNSARVHVALVVGLAKLSLHELLRRRDAIVSLLFLNRRDVGGVESGVAELDDPAGLLDGDDPPGVFRRLVHPHSLLRLGADGFGVWHTRVRLVILLPLRLRRRVREFRRRAR